MTHTPRLTTTPVAGPQPAQTPPPAPTNTRGRPSSVEPVSRGRSLPTPRQRRLLRQLAEERGVTFVQPRTSHEASQQIALLLSQPRSSAAERAADRRAVSELVRSPKVTPGSDAPPATERQRQLLRRLCDKRGLTYTEPEDRRVASEQISELLGQARGAAAWRRDSDEPVGVLPASSVRDFEVSGYGASAHWSR